MRKFNRGFTLVELIVSVALLAIILVPVAGFFTNSFKIQGKSSMKASITRVGQYIMESFKNKNYLSEELKNESGDKFSDFVENIELDNNAPTGEEPEYRLKESDKNSRLWKLNYKNIDYNVNIEFTGFNTSDLADFEIVPKGDCTDNLVINSDGSFGIPLTSHVATCEVGSSYYNPISKKANNYADYPTIILDKDYPQGKNKATLWLVNNYGASNEAWKKIRIIKEFTEELQVYIEGYNLAILKGLEGDGASAAQTRITSSYVGQDGIGNKKNASELWLDAKMIITDVYDETIRDTFNFSFPVEYDYKEGE